MQLSQMRRCLSGQSYHSCRSDDLLVVVVVTDRPEGLPRRFIITSMDDVRQAYILSSGFHVKREVCTVAHITTFRFGDKVRSSNRIEDETDERSAHSDA